MSKCQSSAVRLHTSDFLNSSTYATKFHYERIYGASTDRNKVKYIPVIFVKILTYLKVRKDVQLKGEILDEAPSLDLP